MSFSIAFGTTGYWLVFIGVVYFTFLTLIQNVKNNARERKAKGLDVQESTASFALVFAFAIALIPYFNVFYFICHLVSHLIKDKTQAAFEEKMSVLERNNQ